MNKSKQFTISERKIYDYWYEVFLEILNNSRSSTSRVIDFSKLTEALESTPDEVLQAFIACQGFLTLNEQELDRFASLVESLGEEYALHAQAWRVMREQERKLWTLVEQSLDELIGKQFPLSTILAHTITWLEEERWRLGFEENAEEARLAPVYNTFMLLYLSRIHDADSKIDEVDLVSQLGAGAHGVSAYLLSTIRHWRKYYDGIVQLYCFDRTIYLTKESDGISLNQSAPDYDQWRKDGDRYIRVKDSYYTLISDSRPDTVAFIMDDFCFSKEEIDKYTCLEVYIERRQQTYTNELRQRRKKGVTWLQAYTETAYTYQRGGIDIYPFELHSQASFVKLMEYACFDKPHKYDQWFRDLCFELSDSFEFNRFRPLAYHVLDRPFLSVGAKIYFVPMLFLAECDWILRAPMKLMSRINGDNHKRKEYSRALEETLHNRLRDSLQLEKTKWIDQEYFGKGNGDIDIFLEDEETTLLIQVKCSNIRTELRELYAEKLQSEAKAYKQLNEAEQYLRNNPENKIWQLNPNKQVVKWLVSTSLELGADAPDGLQKVSYLELLFSLYYFEGVGRKGTLRELIQMMKPEAVLCEGEGIKIPLVYC